MSLCYNLICNGDYMDLYFYFIQLIGFIAWVLLAISYYRKDTNHILVFQIISTILFCSSLMQHHGTILSKDSTKKMNISFFVEETK